MPVAQQPASSENGVMDDLAWLRLQIEWGADEALDDRPVDRRRPVAVQAATPPRPISTPLPTVSTPLPTLLPSGAGALGRAQALAAAAQSPAELREALAGFDGCALRATATNLVFSDGDPAARTILVADVPGPAEDRAGIPFAGTAAAFLDKMFASAALDRATFLATSLLPWRPPGDRKPTDGEIQLCLPFLLRHLALLAPAQVLLFGNLAARTLLPGDARRIRPGWQDLPVSGLAQPVAALTFPSVMHIQATPTAKREAWTNILRLRRRLDPD